MESILTYILIVILIIIIIHDNRKIKLLTVRLDELYNLIKKFNAIYAFINESIKKSNEKKSSDYEKEK